MSWKNPQRYAISLHGMVATQHDLATRAAIDVLSSGGNAFDAAVAAAFALTVCEPQASGLAGQTMATLYEARSKRVLTLDGSSRVPNRATTEAISKKQTRLGHKATTVPSTPAVLNYIRRQYGTQKLSQLLAPAVDIAKSGFFISKLQHKLIKRELEKLQKRNAKKIFLKRGKPYKEGDLFKQPILAKTLLRLAKHGIKDFYHGKIAQQICADMKKNKGFIQMDDLAQIPIPIEREALRCRFQGLMLYTFPPPGAGRTLVEILNLLGNVPKKLRNLDKPEGVLYLAGIIQKANQDRSDRPFDRDYFVQTNNKQTLSKKYAKKTFRQMRKHFGSGDTTHLSIMDKDGNCIALTQSIERVFGACTINEKLGFLYNNYMSSLDVNDMSHPYFLRPNAVPWASVAPTIIFKKKKPWMVIGSPGSQRISSTIAQILLRLQKYSYFDAVSAPRLHCDLKGKVSIEGRFDKKTLKLLKSKKFTINLKDDYDFYLGCISMVVHERGQFIGIADTRRDGSAKGLHVLKTSRKKKKR